MFNNNQTQNILRNRQQLFQQQTSTMYNNNQPQGNIPQGYAVNNNDSQMEPYSPGDNRYMYNNNNNNNNRNVSYFDDSIDNGVKNENININNNGIQDAKIVVVDATNNNASPVNVDDAQKAHVGTPLYHDSRFPELDTKFLVDGYKDVPFAVFFILNSIAIVILGLRNYAVGFPALTPNMYNFSNLATTTFAPGGGAFPATTATNQPQVSTQDPAAALALIASGTGVGFGLTILFVSLMLFLLRKFTHQFIAVSVSVVVGLMLLLSVFTFTQNATAGFVNVFFAIIFAVWFYLIRKRIPLASIMLEWATRVVVQYPASLAASIGALLANLIFFICWIAVIVPPLINIFNSAVDSAVLQQQQQQQEQQQQQQQQQMYSTNSNGQQRQQTQVADGTPLIFVYGMFSLYWFGQVASNVVTVTVSGLVATDYFVGGDRNGMPSNPTLASLKRAMTFSFGSICFGSLIVAIIQTLHWLARTARNHNRNSFALAIAVCLLNQLERLMKWLNKYAYCHCAIYGMSFIDASKATWTLVEKSGISAVINDDLVGITFFIVGLFDSIIVAGITCAMFGGDGAIFLIVAFLSSFVHVLVFQCINAGVTTIFICFAESPAVIDTHRPEVRQRIDEAVLIAREGLCGGGIFGNGEDQIEAGRREANTNPNNNTGMGTNNNNNNNVNVSKSLDSV